MVKQKMRHAVKILSYNKLSLGLKKGKMGKTNWAQSWRLYQFRYNNVKNDNIVRRSPKTETLRLGPK